MIEDYTFAALNRLNEKYAATGNGYVAVVANADVAKPESPRYNETAAPNPVPAYPAF